MLGSIGIAIYRSVMADGVPAGLSPDAVTAAQATLGGAVAVAAGLSDPQRHELLGGRGAFAQAFQLVSIISAVIALVLAPLAARVLRLKSGPLQRS
jgi:DHA2 family multidrug resistance protein-like MFS transporter